MKNNKNNIYKLELINKSKLIEIFNDLKSDMEIVKNNPNYQEYLNEELEFLNGWCDVIICAINRHDSLVEKLEQQEKENEEYKEALRIVFEKRVDISIIYYSQNVNDYNNSIVFRFKPSALEQCKLTEDEFNLLKKYAENSKFLNSEGKNEKVR